MSISVNAAGFMAAKAITPPKIQLLPNLIQILFLLLRLCIWL
ncbi:hypothetical protein MNBD_ALPHA11-1977 [hydrothermal vent metagenome]|uniref:Uncharacterized protein n=1 Tax=hydrothermal vent metagenome TaxID=652676 RepID=A0A3B0UFM2_9ZZZZ